MKLTRRDFVKTTAIGAAGIMAYKAALREAYAFANSGNLKKWLQPLRGLNYPEGHILGVLGYPNDPNGIPVAGGVPDPNPNFANTTMYSIGVQEYTDQLHPDLGPTKLWGYVDLNNPQPKHLGGLIVALRGQPARLRFTNTLPNRHIIPVDTTISGANQAQNRIATHIHGGFVPWISDGGPFDWFTPGGQGYATGLSFQNGPGSVLDNIQPMSDGQADYYYPNDQSTRLVWYHDHAHGITRLNAYAGIASGYLIVDGQNDAGRLTNKVPPLSNLIPLVFQDKIFVSATTPTTDKTWATVARPDVQSIGSLWYAHVYEPKLYKVLKTNKVLVPLDPSCVPEFFGDTMLANGTVYPTLTVDPKAYRFMILNACNARFLNINLFQVAQNVGEVTTDPKTGFAAAGTLLGPQIVQIGSEGGYLAADVVHPGNTPVNPATMTGNLLLAPAERADVVIDFSPFAGKELIMYNDSPAPFPGGSPLNDYYLGNPANPVQPLAGTGPDTRNIFRIKVNNATPAPANNGPFLNSVTLPTPIVATPTAVNLDPVVISPITTTVAPIPPLAAPFGLIPRDLTLNEDFDNYGRLRQTIGLTTPAPGGGFGLEYLYPPTEVVTAGATEVWRIFNLTADTHPIHFHLVNVQILSRQPFKVSSGRFLPTGVARGPEPDELGWKETVKMHPGEVTTVVMKFDLPTTPFAVPSSQRTGGNEYVYHCHILEHEEHDMMRPLVVLGSGQVAMGSTLSVQPDIASLPANKGGTVAYSIIGGTGPYTVTSANPAVVPVLTVTGFSVTVKNNVILPGTIVVFTVKDAVGSNQQTVKAELYFV
jgi:spore coat protein A, manganese oxidase